MIIAQELAKRDGRRAVNRSWCWKTYTDEPYSQDLRRFIAEGYGVLSGKDGGRGRRFCGIRHLYLTAKGRALLPPALEVRVGVPYAHRADGLREFRDANPRTPQCRKTRRPVTTPSS